MMTSYYNDLNVLIDSGLQSWTSLYEDALKAFSNVADVQKYRPDVERFINEMKSTRAGLDRMKTLIKTDADAAKFNRLSAQYQQLKETFMNDARVTGVIPLMVVAGIAVGAGAFAWAVSMWQYATGLRERVVLETAELEARVSASKDGRKLQASTLPTDDKTDWKALLAPVGFTAALLGGLWYVSKKM